MPLKLGVRTGCSFLSSHLSLRKPGMLLDGPNDLAGSYILIILVILYNQIKISDVKIITFIK